MERQQLIREKLDLLKEEIWQINEWLFEHPELSDHETMSCAYLTELLERHHFMITTPFAGLPTGFKAVLENGSGPTIAFLAEYDALPGYGPEKKPAHACGHSWIAASCAGAAITLEALREYWNGTVIVFGCPAEETAGRKYEMVQAHAFDHVDAAFQFHPGNKTTLSASMLAMYSVEFRFLGRAAHAAAAPFNGINALDAVIQLFNGINALRQQLTDDVRVHGIITEGGQVPNIIPDDCRCFFYVRAARKAAMYEVMEKVKKCAEGAALMTGCRMEISHYENPFEDMVPNHVLNELLLKNMEAAGLGTPASGSVNLGSSDVGNVSYACPAALGCIELGDGISGPHEDGFLNGITDEKARTQLVRSVECFVGTALDLYGNPDLVKAARAAFEKEVQ